MLKELSFTEIVLIFLGVILKECILTGHGNHNINNVNIR